MREIVCTWGRSNKQMIEKLAYDKFLDLNGAPVIFSII